MTAKVFRAMKCDSAGRSPRVEASARGLGVRRKEDLAPCPLGLAHPQKGGMSVAPSITDLPTHRVPIRLGALVMGASGSNSDRVWVLGEEPFSSGPFAVGLALRVETNAHGLVEPSAAVPFEQYEQDLAATAPLWTVGES